MLRIVDRAGFAGDTLTLQLYADNLKLPERGVLISCEIGYAETGTWDVGTFSVEDITLKGSPPTMIIQAISSPQGKQVSLHFNHKKGASLAVF